jgi:hypothetical protein
VSQREDAARQHSSHIPLPGQLVFPFLAEPGPDVPVVPSEPGPCAQPDFSAEDLALIDRVWDSPPS